MAPVNMDPLLYRWAVLSAAHRMMTRDQTQNVADRNAFNGDDTYAAVVERNRLRKVIMEVSKERQRIRIQMQQIRTQYNLIAGEK